MPKLSDTIAQEAKGGIGVSQRVTAGHERTIKERISADACEVAFEALRGIEEKR